MATKITRGHIFVEHDDFDSAKRAVQPMLKDDREYLSLKRLAIYKDVDHCNKSSTKAARVDIAIPRLDVHRSKQGQS